MTRSSLRAGVRGKRRIHRRSERMIRILVADCGSPAAVMELYYWSREPGMIEIMRGIVAMAEETRAALEAFIAMARDPKAIGASLNPDGVLTFASADVSQTIALARYVADNDSEDSARMFN
jgi:hypothetical protein